MFIAASFQHKVQKIDLNNSSIFINAILTGGGRGRQCDGMGAYITHEFMGKADLENSGISG